LIATFLAAVAVTLGALTGASEWLVRAKVAPEDTFFKHVALFNDAHSPYAAFGDSHVARGFDAAAPVLNLGYSSENIEQTAWKAERYLEHVPHPKIVLLQADPHLFSAYRTTAGMQGYQQSFAVQSHARLLSLSDYYRPQLPLLWQAFFEKHGKLKSDTVFTEQGTLLSPGDLTRWSQSNLNYFIKERAKLHQPIADFEHSPDARRYSEMVRMFLNAGAEVCLVAFPVAPVYRERVLAQSPEAQAQFARAMDFFESFEADPGVRFIDHRALYDDPSLYRDPDHLNGSGAKEYGPVLQSDCFANAGDKRLQPAIALKD
jgi:hypothetical protein